MLPALVYCFADFTATETREPSVSREVTSKAAAAAAASRDRTPTKTAATPDRTAGQKSLDEVLRGPEDNSAGIQMQELKKGV